MGRGRLAAGAVAALALVGIVAVTGDDVDAYEVRMLMPSAEGAIEGATAMVNGHGVGRVTDIGVQGGQALVTVRIDEEFAPLHAGTRARIRWNSILGRRNLELLPGPERNPELPSGKTISSDIERVELDDVLAALDSRTRKNVQGLVKELQSTLGGNEKQLRNTLTQAGPFVEALGEVLDGVGQDGAAIRSLVKDLHGVTRVLATRDQELGRTVGNLSSLLRSVAAQQKQVKAALQEAPGTLQAGTEFLGRVPRAVDAAVPLLEDLQPATRQLPALARHLNPVLRDLRPTVDALRPTLGSLQSLLQFTPGLLDSAHATVPELESALYAAGPAVSFLRPYTPEVIGFATNWTSIFASKNMSGHYGRALITTSASALNSNPGILPPGLEQDPAPAPGSLVGQAWTDANGDTVR